MYSHLAQLPLPPSSPYSLSSNLSCSLNGVVTRIRTTNGVSLTREQIQGRVGVGQGQNLGDNLKHSHSLSKLSSSPPPINTVVCLACYPASHFRSWHRLIVPPPPPTPGQGGHPSGVAGAYRPLLQGPHTGGRRHPAQVTPPPPCIRHLGFESLLPRGPAVLHY